MRGGYFAFMGLIVSVLGNFTISVVLARQLGPEGLGILALYNLLGVLIVPLFSIMLHNAVTKYVAELRHSDLERMARTASTALILLIATGCVGSVFTVAVVAPLAGAIYGHEALRTMVSILGLSLLINFVSLFSAALLLGLEDFAAGTVAPGLSVLANVALLLVFVPLWGLVGAAAAGIGTVALQAGILSLFVRHNLAGLGLRWRWRFDWLIARRLLAFVAPLNVVGLTGRMSSLVQSSFVALYISFVELGYLRVAAVFFGAILLAPRMLLGPMLPVLSGMFATKSEDERRVIVTRLTKIGILMVLPPAATLVFLIPFLTQAFFGPEFLPAVWYSVILILAATLQFPSAILGDQYLLAAGRTTSSMTFGLYAALSSLGLSLLLLPRLGAAALPWASLIAESTVFGLLIAWLASRREIQARPLLPTLTFLTAYLLAVPLAFYLLPLSISPLVAVPVGAAMAALGFFFLLSAEERSIVWTGLRRGVPRTVETRGKA